MWDIRDNNKHWAHKKWLAREAFEAGSPTCKLFNVSQNPLHYARLIKQFAQRLSVEFDVTYLFTQKSKQTLLMFQNLWLLGRILVILFDRYKISYV